MSTPQSDKVRHKLPPIPLYRMLLDGAQTRKIIQRILDLVQVIDDGDFGDIEVDNPQLALILQTLSNRITALEETVPQMQQDLSEIKAMLKAHLADVP